jgi:hypothetical protein
VINASAAELSSLGGVVEGIWGLRGRNDREIIVVAGSRLVPVCGGMKKFSN